MKMIGFVLIALTLASCKMSTYQPYFDMAEHFYVAGDYTRAIEMYIESLRQKEKRPEAFFGLAMAYYQKGELEEAMLAFEKVIELDPKRESAYERLASVQLDLGNPDTAIALCTTAIGMDHEFVQAYNTLAHGLFDIGKADSAEDTFAYCIHLAQSLSRRDRGSGFRTLYLDEQAEAYNGIGEIALSGKLYTRALEKFGAAIELVSDWETPWINKGRTYEGLGNSTAAIICYQRSIDLAPKVTSTYKRLAELYRRIAQDGEAVDTYRAAVRIDPTDVELYYGMADIYEKRHDYTRAGGALENIIRYAPDDPSGYYRTGRLWINQSDYDRALVYFNRALDLDSHHAEALNGLGVSSQTSLSIIRAP